MASNIYMFKVLWGLSVACDVQVVDHHSRSQVCQEKDGQHQLALEERRTTNKIMGALPVAGF